MTLAIFRSLLKKLLGARYERAWKSLGLLAALLMLFRLYGMTLPFSFGVFRLSVILLSLAVSLQMLSSEEMACSLKGQFMLPFQPAQFNLAYLAACSLHTMLTKSAYLLVLFLGCTPWNSSAIADYLISSLFACTAAFCLTLFLYRKKKGAAGLLLGMLLGISLPFGAVCIQQALALACTGGMLWMLSKGDAFAFYRNPSASPRTVGTPYDNGLAMLRYFIRYMLTHKNYLVNTLAMWGVSILLAGVLGGMHFDAAFLLGLGVLSLNTPISILISSDSGLHRKIHAIPGQALQLYLPYTLFIAAVLLVSYAFYVAGWAISNGSLPGFSLPAALLFALQSAILLVMLEAKFPLIHWRTESDLWHHPRKYLVPLIMCLLATLISLAPWMLYVLSLTLVCQALIFLFSIQRRDAPDR